MPGGAKAVPVDRYPELDWWAVDFSKKMTILFIAEGTPMETRYAKVAGVTKHSTAGRPWRTR